MPRAQQDRQAGGPVSVSTDEGSINDASQENNRQVAVGLVLSAGLVWGTWCRDMTTQEGGKERQAGVWVFREEGDFYFYLLL